MQLPDTHPLFVEDDIIINDSYVWAALKITISYESVSRISDFLNDREKITKKQKETICTAYRIP